MLELAILGVLKEQPLHGYELKKRLGDVIGHLGGVSFGSVYPALSRLEHLGMIEAAEPAGSPAPPIPATGSLSGDLAAARRRRAERALPTSRRTRKAYRITPAGEAMFTELLLGQDDTDDDRAFALRLAFLGHAPRGSRVALLERRRAVLEQRLSRCATDGPGRRDRYTRALAEHRARSIRHDLEWIRELITAETHDDLDDPTTPHSAPRPTTSSGATP